MPKQFILFAVWLACVSPKVCQGVFECQGKVAEHSMQVMWTRPEGSIGVCLKLERDDTRDQNTIIIHSIERTAEGEDPLRAAYVERYMAAKVRANQSGAEDPSGVEPLDEKTLSASGIFQNLRLDCSILSQGDGVKLKVSERLEFLKDVFLETPFHVECSHGPFADGVGGLPLLRSLCITPDLSLGLPYPPLVTSCTIDFKKAQTLSVDGKAPAEMFVIGAKEVKMRFMEAHSDTKASRLSLTSAPLALVVFPLLGWLLMRFLDIEGDENMPV